MAPPATPTGLIADAMHLHPAVYGLDGSPRGSCFVAYCSAGQTIGYTCCENPAAGESLCSWDGIAVGTALQLGAFWWGGRPARHPKQGLCLNPENGRSLR